jgi:hypothetical protein
MAESAAELARHLAHNAEAVCRHYLSNGRRHGRYWLAGDVHNTPGRSLFVRLHGPESGRGAAGRWTDAATGQHGDLLDLIRASCGLTTFRDVAAEARTFLSLPRPEPTVRIARMASTRARPPQAHRRLFAISRPIAGTLAQAYLHRRGITELGGTECLRFHPRCYYQRDRHELTELWPALIAAVTDLDGRITGLHRTWLDPDGFSEALLGKAPIDTPRRAMGDILGHAVRFGSVTDVMAAGEGIETVLSLRSVLPHMPMVAALSAAHLGVIMLPNALRRLYVARDADQAGYAAEVELTERARRLGIDVVTLSPRLGDFNEDLRLLRADELRSAIRIQLAPEDVPRFMAVGD